jgi:ribose transport system substrate-binding protein
MIRSRPVYMTAIGVAVLSTVLAACGSSGNTTGSASGSGKHYTIAYELGYVANNWQKEAENLTIATSKVAPYKSKVSLQVHIAGQSVETQISQTQQDIAQGVNAIILYPLSPTALAPVVKQACAKGIDVFTYDAFVNAPARTRSRFHTRPPLPARGAR